MIRLGTLFILLTVKIPHEKTKTNNTLAYLSLTFLSLLWDKDL